MPLMRFRCLVALLLLPTPLAAQGPSLGIGAPQPPDHVTGLQVGVALGGIAAVSAIDRPLRRYLQAHRSPALDEVAEQFRRMGTPVAYASAGLGLVGIGLISGDHDVTRAGGRVILSEAVTFAGVELIKKVVGRARPDAGKGPWDIDPFHNKQVSFVSGHTATAFALATTLSDDLHNAWASVGLYTLAAGTAWSRLNDNRHWASDVLGGAMLGITTAKVIDNRWELAGITAPRFLTDPPAPAP